MNKLLKGYLSSTVDIKKTDNKHNVKKELNNLIKTEFNKTYVKELYINPKWTSRVFWVIITNVENDNEQIELYDIVRGVRKYLINHNLPIPIIDWSKWGDISDEWKQISTEWNLSQRDTIKFVRDAINDLQADGLTKITDVSKHTSDNGISQERFNQAIKTLRMEGSIFEPKEGFYKCI